ncbi:MAG: caspase family protein [Nannocystaceae bacterium]|nr:caspase family protein [Nannocystaceae bacterium]
MRVTPLLWTAWAVAVLLGMLARPGAAHAEDPLPTASAVVRVALLVASNAGPPDRATLRYAQSDAHAVSEVLQRVGGLDPRNEVLIYNATPKQLERGFQRVIRRARESAAAGHRVEFVFYYSGHSDEQGLLLGRDTVSYKRLRGALETVPADVKIAILDSCASGAFTRIKGGKRRAPFLIATTTKVSGHAYLTSSSIDENAQEADRIGGSFFTHFFTSGLRGAADRDGDRLVTLGEAYRFAFEETLANTETSLSGAQHASYDFDLSGSGDLVMTDLRRTTGRLVLDPQVKGRISVRGKNGGYVAELRMPEDASPVVLALEPGEYTVTSDDGRRLARATITVPKSGHIDVLPSDFKPVERENTTARGNEPAGEYIHVPVNIGVMPVVSSGGGKNARITHFGASLGWSHSARTHGIAMALAADVTDEEVRGAQWTVGGSFSRGNVVGSQLSVGLNWAGTDVRGSQMSVGFNRARQLYGAQLSSGVNWAASMRGLQLSAGLNMAGTVDGAQLANVNIASKDVRGAQLGLVNVTKGHVRGVQLGLVNYAESADAAIGLLSITKEGGVHPEVWTSDTAGLNVGLRLPAGYTYSFLAAGVHPAGKGKAWQFGLGFGGHVPVRGPAAIDIDLGVFTVFSGLTFSTPNASLAKLRLMFSWEFMPRLTAFGGPTFNVGIDDPGHGQPRPGYPWIASSHTRDRDRVRLWPGFVAGLRF